MKKLSFLFIITPCLLFAQNNKPIGSFCIENNAIIYRHVFADSLDAESVIVQKLLSQIPASPNINTVNEFNNGQIITGAFESQNANEGSPWELIK
ncbi:MAG TPA: hypothetical protein VK808_08365, partial [Bacteroidia bacterium]|nr:hypothetical protein [Bacteroidia bacterium]